MSDIYEDAIAEEKQKQKEVYAARGKEMRAGYKTWTAADLEKKKKRFASLADAINFALQQMQVREENTTNRSSVVKKALQAQKAGK